MLLLFKPAQGDWTLWCLLIALAVFSATQDIAIDAYKIELLDEEEMGPANGVRVSLYRVALICAGGVFVAIAGIVGWRAAFAAASGLFTLSAVLSSRAPETIRPQSVHVEQERWPSNARACGSGTATGLLATPRRGLCDAIRAHI